MINCNYCKNNKYCIAWKIHCIDVRLKVEENESAKHLIPVIVHSAQFKLGRDMATDCKKYKSTLFEESK